MNEIESIISINKCYKLNRSYYGKETFINKLETNYNIVKNNSITTMLTELGIFYL